MGAPLELAPEKMFFYALVLQFSDKQHARQFFSSPVIKHVRGSTVDFITIISW
jgi:hypothetical protein